MTLDDSLKAYVATFERQIHHSNKKARPRRILQGRLHVRNASAREEIYRMIPTDQNMKRLAITS